MGGAVHENYATGSSNSGEILASIITVTFKQGQLEGLQKYEGGLRRLAVLALEGQIKRPHLTVCRLTNYLDALLLNVIHK